MDQGDNVQRVGQPVWVGELDIARPGSRSVVDAVSPDGDRYGMGRILVRFRGEPIGMLTVDLPDGELDVDRVRTMAHERFRHGIDRAGGQGWNPSSEPIPSLSPEFEQLAGRDLPGVSIVIGTRNRPDLVTGCVERLLAQEYAGPFEVIVVDNGADDSSTAEAVEESFGDDSRVRYLSEPRPGLSRARNIGLYAARHPITTFLSDDIRVDDLWLLAIARGFARDPAVKLVTGFCPPLYLDNAEQLMFESSMAWGTRQGFAPELYRFDNADDPVHPYRAGSYVNGSNMSYDTETFQRLGGFDEALGPGTMARGGEDLDAPIRILADGGIIAFEPAVLGWHADRYDDRSFSRHMYTYGLGLTAFLTKHLVESDSRAQVLKRIPAGFPMLLKAFGEPDEDLIGNVHIPLKYHLWHLAGRLAGPAAYLRSRRYEAALRAGRPPHLQSVSEPLTK